MSEEVANANDNTSADEAETTQDPQTQTPEVGKLESLLDTEDKNTEDTKDEVEPKDDKIVPEEYEEYKAPEGVTFDKDLIGDFNSTAKELNLSQDQAQQLVDIAIKNQTQAFEAQKQQWQNTFVEWNKEIKNDKEFGGINLSDTVIRYKRAMADYGTPELKDLLIQSGYEHHPALIKHFAGLDKKYGEDKSIGGEPTGNAEKTIAEIMFGKNK